MNVLLIQLLLLIILQILLAAFQIFGSNLSSDHYYHLNLINGIRNNGHSFLRAHPNIIGGKYFAYPQLYHWILSFLPSKVIEKFYILFGLCINLFQLILFMIFSFTVYPFISNNLSDMQKGNFLLLSGLVFVLTPFSYAIWNAKNKGLSARGFGLFFGQIYLYLIIWYYLFDNIFFLIFSFIVTFIILLSNQFSMQFVILSAPMLALLFKNSAFLLIPPFAFLLFYLVFPEIARSFIKGQIGHKALWFKYLAEKFILRSRYSIWRDFVWDFWIKRFENLKRKIFYVLYNPVLSIIWGFPVFTLAILRFWFYGDDGVIFFSEDRTTLYLTIPVIVTFCTFLITSLKKTRFLGEPERYMEFSIPQLSVLGVIFLDESGISTGIFLGICFLLVVSQFILQHLQGRYGSANQRNQAIEKIREHLSKVENTNISSVRIFSNNGNINKMFLSGRAKILNIDLTSFYTGPFHFKKICPVEYPYVSEEFLMPLIKEFNINWLILDTTHVLDYADFLKRGSFTLEEEMAEDRYRLLKVS